MRALQASTLDGPDGLELVELPDGTPTNPIFDPAEVVIDVHAAGASFPDLLFTRGLYQLRVEPPFVPGCEVAGTVRASAGGFEAGERVAAFTYVGGFAETATAPGFMTVRLPDRLDFAAGAALV